MEQFSRIKGLKPLKMYHAPILKKPTSLIKMSDTPKMLEVPKPIPISAETAVKLNSTINKDIPDVTDFEPEDEGIKTINHLIRINPAQQSPFVIDPALLKYFNAIRRGKLIKFIVAALISQIPLVLVLLVK
jgi:hypothetical protein